MSVDSLAIRNANFDSRIDSYSNVPTRRIGCTTPDRRRAIFYGAAYTWCLTAAVFFDCYLHVKDPLLSCREQKIIERERQKQSTAFVFYKEYGNGSREKMTLRIPNNIDERVLGQIHLKQTLIFVFAVPGVFLPLLTIYAYTIKTPRHFLWWICWMSAHNMHTAITFVVDCLKIFFLDPYNPFVFFQRGKEAFTEPSLYFTARELLGLTKLLTVPYSFYIVYVVFMFYCDCLVYAWGKHVADNAEDGSQTESSSLPEVVSSDPSILNDETPKSPWGLRCVACSQTVNSQHAVISLKKWRSYGSSSSQSQSTHAEYCAFASDSTSTVS